MRFLTILATASLAALPARAQAPKAWTLEPTSKTVEWGHYDPFREDRL